MIFLRQSLKLGTHREGENSRNPCKREKEFEEGINKRRREERKKIKILLIIHSYIV